MPKQILRLRLDSRRVLGLILIFGAILGGAFLSTSAFGGSSDEEEVPLPAPPVGTTPEAFVVSPADKAEYLATALTVSPDPTGSTVADIAPSYDDDGSIGSVVVELNFPPFSGTFDLPGSRLLEANREKYNQRVDRRYVVDGLQEIYVAIDVDTGEVTWSTLSFTSTYGIDVVTSVENLSFAQRDHKGRHIPAGALPVEYED